jgi:hypothetical protein
MNVIWYRSHRSVAGRPLRQSAGRSKKPRPKNPKSATPEEAAAFKKSSWTPLPRTPKSIPAKRSRSSTDGRRIGLKPVTHRVCAPIGERPIAHGYHRFDWLYVTAFVSPATGETFWYLSSGVSKEFFEALLETFAREAKAGVARIILLVLDNPGWHGAADLKIPRQRPPAARPQLRVLRPTSRAPKRSLHISNSPSRRCGGSSMAAARNAAASSSIRWNLSSKTSKPPPPKTRPQPRKPPPRRAGRPRCPGPANRACSGSTRLAKLGEDISPRRSRSFRASGK